MAENLAVPLPCSFISPAHRHPPQGFLPMPACADGRLFAHLFPLSAASSSLSACLLFPHILEETQISLSTQGLVWPPFPKLPPHPSTYHSSSLPYFLLWHLALSKIQYTCRWVLGGFGLPHGNEGTLRARRDLSCSLPQCTVQERHTIPVCDKSEWVAG